MTTARRTASRVLIRIPQVAFTVYWTIWYLAAGFAVVMNERPMLWPLVGAFALVELAGILMTDNMQGTLTDTTAQYVPQDLTFILMALMMWRLNQWENGSWREWALGYWLFQHFVKHYAIKEAGDGDVPS